MKTLLTDQIVADRVSLRTLLGLGPRNEDVGDLRQLQLAPLRGKGSLRLWMGIGMALVAAFTMVHSAPLPVIGAWLAGTLSFSLFSYRAFSKLPLGDPKLSGAAEYRLCNRHALYSSVAWSIPFWLLGLSPPLDHVLSMWTISLLMMLTLAIVAHSIPMACILFIAPVSVSAAGALVRAGAPELASVTLVAGLLLSAFCVRFGQAHVRFRRAEEVLHEKTETVSLLLREFEETSADWLWQTDNNRRLIHVTPRLAYALGGTAEALEGVPLLQALSGDAWTTGNFPKTLHDMAERMKRRESFSNLIVPVTIGGKPRWWELSASPRLDETGKFLGFRGVGSDVTEQHATAEQIAKMARFDNLTGLPNRLSLHEDLARALQHAIEAKSRCAMLMIDLDRFKAVNDTLGHPVGDKLLAQVAARLKGMMERGMTCGRLGGDEFAVVLHNVPSANEAEELATRIIQTISRPYVVDNHQLFVGASVGFAIGPTDGATVETLTRNADLALYAAKGNGRGRFRFYSSDLHQAAEDRRALEEDLRDALVRGEMELTYQPVVQAKTNLVTGVEALIRWTHPERGVISPSVFVPIAEEANLIWQLGEWVLRKACQDAARWPGDLRVAVNVSPIQFANE
ncbi:MAG: diguanylate cyclase, partial [Sphingopyxis sp.]|nr:diguanylate cyclase [Sphingopyxis sp.]